MYGSASQVPGQVLTTGTINGIPLDHAALWLPAQSSGTQIEQVQEVQGAAQTAGATLQLTSALEQGGGRQSATSGAGSDPSQLKPGYQSATAGAQATGSLSAAGNNNTMTVNWGANDSAGTTSTINQQSTIDSSSPPRSGPCILTPPSSVFDQTPEVGLPCGDSKAQQNGTVSSALSIKAGPNNVPTTLASISAAAAPSGAFTDRESTSKAAQWGTACAAASGDGCLESLQYRALGTVSLVQLPIGVGQLLPLADLPGYDSAKGIVQLTGFSDYAEAEAGLGAGKPQAKISAGTIAYFNGTGYSTLDLTGAAGSGPTAIPIGTGGNGVHVSDTAVLGALLQIDVTANLTTGGTGVTDPAGCASTCTRTQASATSNSPIVGSFNYTLTYAGAVLCNVTTTVDFGRLLAKSSYNAAPSGG
jgi:hypothetical protein